MRDQDLPKLLRDAAGDLAGDRSLADTLDIAALAAGRRLGVWKAALARPEDLSGGIRALRDAAARALDASARGDTMTTKTGVSNSARFGVDNSKMDVQYEEYHNVSGGM